MARTAIREAPGATAAAVLGAMRAVALEHGGPGMTEMDRETIGSAATIVLGLGEVDVDAIAPVDPAGLASATADAADARRAVRMLSVMSLADGEIDAEKTALVRAYAEALGVEAEYLGILTEAAADEIAQAAACMVRKNAESFPNLDCEPTAGQRDRPVLPLQRRRRPGARGALQDARRSPGRHLRPRFLRSLPPNGFLFPGDPDGLAEGFTTPHDSSHVLSGYSTSEGGEICVSTFIGAMHPDHPMAAEVLPVIFSWHLGVKLNDIANSTTGVFEPRHFWTAWERGAATQRRRRRSRLGLLGRDDRAAGGAARRLRRAGCRPGDARVALRVSGPPRGPNPRCVISPRERSHGRRAGGDEGGRCHDGAGLRPGDRRAAPVSSHLSSLRGDNCELTGIICHGSVTSRASRDPDMRSVTPPGTSCDRSDPSPPPGPAADAGPTSQSRGSARHPRHPATDRGTRRLTAAPGDSWSTAARV